MNTQSSCPIQLHSDPFQKCAGPLFSFVNSWISLAILHYLKHRIYRHIYCIQEINDLFRCCVQWDGKVTKNVSVRSKRRLQSARIKFEIIIEELICRRARSDGSDGLGDEEQRPLDANGLAAPRRISSSCVDFAMLWYLVKCSDCDHRICWSLRMRAVWT